MKIFFGNRKGLLIILLAFNSIAGSAQLYNYGIKNLHSHNDYEQDFPFWDAFNHGFGSIEVDVFLKNNQLLVGHEETALNQFKTIEALYLNPLNQVVGFKKLQQPFILLVDLKTEAISTLNVLLEILKNYPQLSSEKNLRITITGKQPSPSSFNDYPSWIWFDGNLGKNYSASEFKKISLMSANLNRFTKWNGKGVLPKQERERIEQIIEQTTKKNAKPVRFWNAPDIPNAWYQLMKLGVSYINTDQVAVSATFMKQLPANSYYANQQQLIYQPTYHSDGINKTPKKIILLIADGMGMAQLHAAYTANRGDLTTFKIRHTGWALTASRDSYITDSAPGATAYSAGSKTNNRAVGVNEKGVPLKLLPDYFAELGMKTAIISSGDITDATPAAFYAHQSERSAVIPILADIKDAKFSILMGAGNNVIDSFLRANPSSTQQLIITDSIAGKPVAKGRGDWLTKSFLKSIELLNSTKNGFFIMAEGAQVDYGGHQNQLSYVVTEVLDFDQLVSAAIEFADKDGETLVIITADHETGGLTLLDGDISKGYVSGHFSTTDHTAIPVPVFAYGPKSYLFGGIFENTAVFKKIIEAVKN